MNLRVKGFDPTAENFGRSRVVRDLGNGNSGVLERFGRSAATNNIKAKFVDQFRGKFNDSGFV